MNILYLTTIRSSTISCFFCRSLVILERCLDSNPYILKYCKTCYKLCKVSKVANDQTTKTDFMFSNARHSIV